MSSHNEFAEIDKLLKLINLRHSSELSQQDPEIEINGIKGHWINKDESDNWNGDIPLSEYPINVDNNPIVIYKKFEGADFDLSQEYGVRYLKPPTPPVEDIIIDEVPAPTRELPPIIIRQDQRYSQEEPREVYYREAPPEAPKKLEPVVVRIPGKKLPPPPRKVIIEILPKIPTKPQPIILERWLTPKPVKRRVVYEKGSVNQNEEEVNSKKPEVIINKKYYFIDDRKGLKNEKQIDGLVDKLAKSNKLKNKTSTEKKRYSQSFSLTNVVDEGRNTYSRYIQV